jgi:hypothetical protein
MVGTAIGPAARLRGRFLMLRGVAFLLLAATASAANAQGGPPISVEPPPIMIVEQPVETMEQQFYEIECTARRPMVVVDEARAVRAFVVEGVEPLTLIVCSHWDRTGYAVRIDTLATALVFMAYKPFEPFWPEAEARWGADLAKLRQDLREAATVQIEDRYPYAVRARTVAAISAAQTLASIGYFDEARARLTGQTNALIERRARGTRDLDFDLVMLALNQAAIEMQASNHAAGANFLATFAEAVPVEPVYRVNLSINRAAYLVESGHPKEALELLLPEYESFRAGKGEDRETYQVGGSDREFAWILSCAYANTDQPEKARLFAAIVTSAEETPRDQYMRVTKPSTAIKRRLYRCMDSPIRYFAAWREANEYVLSPAWLEFQHSGEMIMSGVPRPWVATRPEAAELSADYRQLPERYLPALRRWQAAPPAGE